MCVSLEMPQEMGKRTESGKKEKRVERMKKSYFAKFPCILHTAACR